MLYFICWNGKNYSINTEIQNEVVQILCSQEEADRVLKMYAEEGYGKKR